MNHEYLNDDGESIPLETNVSDGNDFAREIQENKRGVCYLDNTR